MVYLYCRSVFAICAERHGAIHEHGRGEEEAQRPASVAMERGSRFDCSFSDRIRPVAVAAAADHHRRR